MLTALMSLILTLFIGTASAAIPDSWELIANFENPEGYEETKARTGLEYPSVFDTYKQPTVVYAETNTINERHIYIAAVDVETYNLAAEALGSDPTTSEPLPEPPIVLDPNLITFDNEPTNGDLVEVSNEANFSVFETLVFSQYINGEGETPAGNPSGYPAGTPYVITIVANDGDGLYSYWKYGRTIDQLVVTDPVDVIDPPTDPVVEPEPEPVVDPDPVVTDPVDVIDPVVSNITFQGIGTFSSPMLWDGEDVIFTVENMPEVVTQFYTPETGEVLDLVTGADQPMLFSVDRINALNKFGLVELIVSNQPAAADDTAPADYFGGSIWIWIEDPIVIEAPCITTKDQARGLVDQLINLMNNQWDTRKANTSVADLYGKVDEVKNELCVLRRLVNESDLP